MRRKRLFLIIMLVASLAWLAPRPTISVADTSRQTTSVPLTWQVIELTNAERAAAGLPPLAHNTALTTAAELHSQSMAINGFFAHDDPTTGATPEQRIVDAGYTDWEAIGENVFGGSDLPSVVVSGWMNSDGHRENILSPNYREIGVGYTQRTTDPQNIVNYWTQDFGARFDYYPIVIENEAYATQDPLVDVYVYGQSVGATEMRFSINGATFTDWQPFSPTTTLTLGTANGSYRVDVEIRVADGPTYAASDTILLFIGGATPTAVPTIDPFAATGLVIENNAYATQGPTVNIFVDGESIGATEMRFAINGEAFGAWQSFFPTTTLTLGEDEGIYTVEVEVRTPDGMTRIASDTILVVPDVNNVTPPSVTTSLVTPVTSINNNGGPTAIAQQPTQTPAAAGPSSPSTGQSNPVGVTDVRPTAASMQDEPSDFERWSCYDFWWWAIPLVVALVLLLILMIHYRFRRFLWISPPTCGWRCRIFRIAFLLYLTFLGFLFGNQIGGMCGEAGTLIWYADARQSSNIVSISNSNPAEDLHWVNGLNNDGCIGCHIYEDQSRRLIYTQGGLTGQLVLFDRDTEQQTFLQVGDQPLVSSYTSLSRDGTRLALALNDNDIYIYDFVEETLTPVLAAATADYVETMPVWGSNGITLIFARTEEPTQGGAILQTPTDLYEYNFETDTISPIDRASEPGVFEYYPALTNDGRWLAFTRHANLSTYADEAAEVWLMDLQRNQTPTRIASDGASWPRFSQDQRWLAYHSQKYDEVSDIWALPFNVDTGVSGEAIIVEGAAVNGVFEHLPALWTLAPPLTLTDILLNWVWWLLPLFPLWLLATRLCYSVGLEEAEARVERREKRRPLPPLTPSPVQKRPAWQTQPALVIGFGTSGRWVLTHLKKTLKDAGLGEVPSDIPLMCVAVGNVARLNQPEAQQGYQFGGVTLDSDEILEWTNNLHETVQQSMDDPALQGWMDRNYLNALGEAGQNPRVGLFNQRVLGRLALIDNLRANSGEQHLWQRLVTRARRAISNNRLTVIVVANMADDVGSGGALDVAYLCRRLKDELQLSEVSIVGHLMTDHVEPPQPPHHAQINTAAFLRELSRFQLSQPQMFNFKMDYGDVSFTGYNNETLFNQLYIYDGTGAGYNVPARRGIYPSIADNIALWLDKGALEKLSRGRDQNQSTAQEAQLQEQTLLVSSLGVYQYRMPVADILENVVMRYTRVGLNVFLAGIAADNNQRPKQLTYEQSSERFLNTVDENPRQLAEEFLNEKFGSPSKMGDRWIDLIRMLMNNDEQNIKRAARRIRHNPDDVLGWRAWLQEVLVILLNGELTAATVSDADYLIKRTGKLGLVTDFLGHLAGEDGYGGILAEWKQTILDVGVDDDAVLEQLAAFGEATADYRTAYGELAELLVLRRSETLYHQLEKRAVEFDMRKDELSTLTNRVYIWDDEHGQPLRDKWYEPLQDSLSVLLSRLYWRFDDAGRPILTLRQLDSSEIVFDGDQVETFVDAMLDIGYLAADTVWRKASLQDILAYTDLQESERNATLERMFMRSQPALAFQQQAELVPTYLIAEEKPTPEAHRFLLERVDQHHFESVGITDRFSFTVAQVVDGVKIYRTEYVEQAFKQYEQENGLTGRAYSPRANIPTSIFAAERTALSYERRLNEINERRRMFHPITVTLLANPNHVEAYLLAATTIAAEASDTRLIDMQNAENSKRVRFNMPQYSAMLVDKDDAIGSVGLFVRGLLRFIEQVDDVTAKGIRDHLVETEDDELLDTYEVWMKSNNNLWLAAAPTKLARMIVEDLILIAKILVKDVI